MLTERQAEFCRHYIASGVAKEAAVRAGYAPGSAKVTGCRLLQNPKVRDKIEALKGRLDSKRIMTAEQVLENISDIAEDGENENTRLRALELMAKHHSLLIERREIVQRDEFDGLTPDQFKQVGPKLRKDIEEWEAKGLVQ